MLNWTCTLNDVEIEEPIGLSEIQLQVTRDPETHGIIFDASLNELGFYANGGGGDYLKEQYDSFGVNANVIFKAVSSCDGSEEIEMITGRLNFTTYKRRCGKQCIVSMNIEQEGCLMTMRNRYDQKVNIADNIAFDKQTGLEDYAGLNFEVEIKAQALDARSEAFVVDEGDSGHYESIDPFDLPGRIVDIRPSFGRVVYNSIDIAQFEPSVQATQMTELDTLLSPIMLFDDNIQCYGDKLFQYEFRMKGRYHVDSNMSDAASQLWIAYIDGGNAWDSDSRVIVDFFEVFNNDVYTANQVVEFDHTFTGSIELIPGRAVYVFLEIGAGGSDNDEPFYYYEFDKETYTSITKVKLCPPTDVNVSMVNETGSRIVEAITDGCLKMKSDYYGRIDSEPYASAQDGCGSLRILTSGLKLRNAPEAVHFMSLSEWFKGLKAIDNIGMGIEDNEFLPGQKWLRVEPAEYFYRDTELLACLSIPVSDFTIEAKEIYSLIKIGYQKWETSRANGLAEFNSKKEFRTTLNTINNTLTQESSLVAGGQPIEVTRQQSFAETGAADTTYDNDVFIICMMRAAYGLEVEQGNISDAENLFDPATILNWRLRPYYNLMRWFKSIAHAYPNLGNTTSKLFFSYGEGNYTAKGFLNDLICGLEDEAKAENDSLALEDFRDPADGIPIYKPENVKFEYPLSLSEYNAIKDNPYGYVTFQCGADGPRQKGYITKLIYKPTAGRAEFNLKLKWQ